ncbi:MAG: hypothetical protein FJ296_04475 [Planctomycetes bacterium]|nr:hypothetical protein [Planctomycetota bacterium]
MGWFGRKLGQKQVAYFQWHLGGGEHACAACRERDGMAWLPERKDVKGPPLREACTCAGGCKCRALEVYADEAWGPGNADWIRKRGGLVTGAQFEKFIGG